MPADLIVNGRIATLAGEAGLGFVDAIAVSGGHVVATGGRDEVDGLRGPGTKVIRLAPDEVALPGLTDAHLHLAEGGLAADDVDLADAPTLVDGLARIATANARLPVGAWLEGHGWLPDRWDCWPSAGDLSTAAPGRRIAIWAHDHHSLWVSYAALRAAGVDAASPDPPGGLIRRLHDGTPSGILHEAAARLVTSHIPPPSPDELAVGIERLSREVLRLGIVAVHDPGGLSVQEGLGPGIEAYRRLAEAGDLPIRAHVCIREEKLAAALEAGLRSGASIGPVGGRLSMGWLKLFADGTLGSRTAALREPLDPEPGRPIPAGTEHRVWITEPAEMTRLAAEAAEAGIATTIHGIGDRAVGAALDALEPTASRSGVMPRLEHIQLLDLGDRDRFARNGVAASVQPIHLRSDAAIARRSWGDRAESRGYPLRSLLETGAVVAFGTDAPVESFDPWPGLEMAVTRRSPDWPAAMPAFGIQERLSLAEALRAQCIGGPMTAGETDRGRLIPGQRADLLVVPAAVVEEPTQVGGPLGRARPRLVVVDGRVAFEA